MITYILSDAQFCVRQLDCVYPLMERDADGHG